ncbi:MAG: diguanylate cyclase, partial [Cyanobacteria bacterium J06600_6]
SLVLFQMNLLQKDSFHSIKLFIIGIILPVGVLLTTSYLLFLAGYWLPTIAPLIALVAANLVVTGYYYQNQKRIAFTDGLTKIANRRFFDHFIKQQWSKCQRNEQDLAVILCDVDFFKIYNDTYGHQEGDNCLQKVALVLNESVRGNDLAARYGGEEFVIVLPNSNTETANIVAKRIRAKLKAMQIPHPGSTVSQYVSISMGISSACHNKAISPQELIEMADKALYQAKKQGRDRAEIYELE